MNKQNKAFLMGLLFWAIIGIVYWIDNGSSKVLLVEMPYFIGLLIGKYFWRSYE